MKVPLLLPLLLLSLTTSGQEPASATARKPNVVLIVADDLGYGDIGAFGQQQIQTPELDRMAREGMRFTQHYSGSTVCAPSRYALMTGQHLGRASTIGQAQQLTVGAQTLGTVMRGAGYRTACIGKWGLGDGDGLPNRQGFDHFFGFVNQTLAHHYYPDWIWRNEERVELKDNPKTHQHYIHDLFIDEALKFIRDSGEKPFFLYLPLTIPHAEVIVPEDSQAPYLPKLGDPDRPPIEKPYELRGYNLPRYPRAARAGMISRMDRDIGRIRALLAELGLAENTLIFFTSDNGPTTAGGQDSQFFKSAGPLRGAKRSLYEGGIRVPTLAVWPGTVPAGSDNALPSIFYDLLPTFAELAGAEVAPPVDGVSFVPSLRGKPEEQKPQEFLFWDYAEKGVTSRLSALRQGRWKLVVDREKPDAKPELYDLEADPGESRDLSAAHPEQVERMLELMRPWWR